MKNIWKYFSLMMNYVAKRTKKQMILSNKKDNNIKNVILINLDI